MAANNKSYSNLDLPLVPTQRTLPDAQPDQSIFTSPQLAIISSKYFSKPNADSFYQLYASPTLSKSGIPLWSTWSKAMQAQGQMSWRTSQRFWRWGIVDSARGQSTATLSSTSSTSPTARVNTRTSLKSRMRSWQSSTKSSTVRNRSLNSKRQKWCSKKAASSSKPWAKVTWSSSWETSWVTQAPGKATRRRRSRRRIRASSLTTKAKWIDYTTGWCSLTATSRQANTSLQLIKVGTNSQGKVLLMVSTWMDSIAQKN